jgi:hypothetical protein
MGFMDKVKSAAQDVTQQAKSATSSAQSKMEESKLRKQADEAAKKLGYEIYRERSQGTPATNSDALIAEIQGLEGQIDTIQQQAAAAAAQAPETPADQSAPGPGPAQSPEATPTAPPPSTSSSEPSSGDFKL